MLLDKDRIVLNVFLVTIWIWCTIGFVSEEMIPGLLPLRSGVYFLVDAIIMALGLIVLRNWKDWIFVLSFLVVGYHITCVHNEYSVAYYLNGLRDFLYLSSLIPIFRYLYKSRISDDFVRLFDKSLYAFLIVQAVCVTFQFLKYGANDHGGGSMGNGYSGIVTILIYVVSFYLMKKRMNPEKYLGSLIANKWLVILLYPTFLNETKISFIFFVMYFLLMLPLKKESLMRVIFAVPILVAGVYLAFNVYLSATGNKDDITDLSYYMEGYLMADESGDILNWAEYLYERGELEADGSSDIPRFTKYMLMPEINASYPGHDITGYGIGQFKGGTMMPSSKFYQDNEWMLRGSVPYGFHMIIQMGLFAVIYFVWFCLRIYSLREKGTKAEIGIQLFLWIMVVVFIFYNDFFRYTFACAIFLYVFIQSLRWHTQENVVKLN